MSSTPPGNSLSGRDTYIDSKWFATDKSRLNFAALSKKGGNKNEGSADEVTVMKRSAAASVRRDLGEIDYPINVQHFICGGGAGGGGGGVGAGGWR